MHIGDVLRVTLVAVLLTACASATTTPSVSVAGPELLQPLVVGWQQFFRLDWQAGERQGQPTVVGRIANTWGKAFSNVQLLVEELDSSGGVTAQHLTWLAPKTITPGTSVQFEVAVHEPSAAYRVSVFAFDWVERGRKL